MSRRRFLVTAATTTLGRAVSQRLATAGEVFGVRAPADPPPYADQTIACVADLCRSAEVRNVLAGVVADAAIDTIVHVGANLLAGDAREVPNALSTRLLLDAVDHVPCVRGFVLCSTALVYRLKLDDPTVVTERHPLDLSSDVAALHRDWLEADVTACQRALDGRLRVAVLRLSPLVGQHARGVLAEYLRLKPCYRALGFDPMINVLSIDDAAEALARAAERGPHGVFNVAGADTLPLSELASRIGVPCWPVPGAIIEPLCALRGVPERQYRSLSRLLHHGLVPDGRAATEAFGFTAHRPLAASNK